MNESNFVAQAVPGISNVLAEPTGHPYHDRRRESVGRAPSQRAAVIQLLGRRIGVLSKLNLGDRHQSADGHPNRPPDYPLFRKAGVEDALLAELPLQPLRDEMHPALSPDVLTEREELGIHVELVPERATNRLGKANHLTFVGLRFAPAE